MKNAIFYRPYSPVSVSLTQWVSVFLSECAFFLFSFSAGGRKKIAQPKGKAHMAAKKRAASADATDLPADRLAGLQAKAAEMRDLEMEIEELTARIEDKSKQVWVIAHEELPALMMDAGVDHVGLPATGNMPAYDAKMTPFYRANIAASWDQDKRKRAFDYLDEIGAGDLIKTEIGIALPREKREEAKKLLASLSLYSPSVKEAVHTGTLTSWLKEQLQDGQSVDLEIIGGETGTTVKLKPRKKD